MVDAIKYLTQAYHGDVDDYEIKGTTALLEVKAYMDNMDLKKGINSGFLGPDSTKTRISVQVADIGTKSMDSLIERVQPLIENMMNPKRELMEEFRVKLEANDVNYVELFDSLPKVRRYVESILEAEQPDLVDLFMEDEDAIYGMTGDDGFRDLAIAGINDGIFGVVITGTSRVFTKGTTYLVNNLFISLMMAVIIIGIMMSVLFRSGRMVLVSLIPNLIPLVTTAAIMGYFGINIKPSTILVFSVAFGISVDDTIHFLAKYRQELKAQSWNIKGSVINAIRETGVSMIYTSIILFFGFGIFIMSNFGGTQALGVLVAVTMIVAMLANLVLLPSLLLTLEKRLTTKSFKEPLLGIIDEEEDIELEDLEIQKSVE